MTFSRTATCDYSGTIMEGKGTTKAGTGSFTVPVSFPRRIGEPEGVTSPEELVAAAHATCYAMVVTGALGRANAQGSKASVTCTITANKGRQVRHFLLREIAGDSNISLRDAFLDSGRGLDDAVHDDRELVSHV